MKISVCCPSYKRPIVKTLKYLPFCKDSGEIFTDICEYDPRGSRIEYGYFSQDNIPNNYCNRHVLCYYDKVTSALASRGCPHENLILTALLDIPERSFPEQIYVTDAEYVWRRMKLGTRFGDSYDVPYYVYSLDEGEFVGKGRRKKQYNSYCYLHNDEQVTK